jgi:tRNA-dihydrouridine synthase
VKIERFKELHDRLKGGFFLSSLHSHGDGAFCAERSTGCQMVQFGIRFAEPPDLGVAQGEYRLSILPFEKEGCINHLADEVQKVKSQENVLTCLNLSSPKLEWAIDASQNFLHAGGDLVELNVHGGYYRYLELGRLRAMVLPEHQAELFQWVEGMVKADIPLIVKFDGRQTRQHILLAVSQMDDFGLLGIHVNVRNNRAKCPDISFVRRIRVHYSGFLFASGYVRSAADARELFNKGVDMVGIGEPVIKDPSFIREIAGQYMVEVN